MERRVEHLDIAKGISILLVALYHSQLSTYIPTLNEVLGLFRLPLFFFISGVFFKPAEYPRVFFLKKTDGLLKPYFFTACSLLFLSVLLGRDQIVGEFVGMLYGTGIMLRWPPMWFLPHLWLVTVTTYWFYLVFGVKEQKNSIKTAYIISFFIIGAWLVNKKIYSEVVILGEQVAIHGLPFSSDCLFISVAFFMSGSILKNSVKNLEPHYFKAGIALAGFTCIASLTDAKIKLVFREFDEPVLAIVAAYMGIYLICTVAYYIAKIELLKKVLKACGRGSLFILIFHWPFGFKLQALFQYVSDGPLGVVSIGVVFFLSIAIPLGMRSIFYRIYILRTLFFPISKDKISSLYARL